MTKGIVVTGATLFATATLANAQLVVLDQIGDPGGADLAGTSASQFFEPAFAAYDIAALDNFTLDSDTKLTSFEAMMSGFAGYLGLGGVTGFNVEIYSDFSVAGLSLTGDVFSLSTATPDTVTNIEMGDGVDTFDTDLVQFDINVNLTAGEYWIALVPTNEFGSNGQTGVRRTAIGDDLSYQANPGGGFMFPGGIQQSATERLNFAYRVEAIPAPGALALLGLAGLAGMRRRRD